MHDAATLERARNLGPYGGLDAASWNALAGRNFYSTTTWLQFCAAEPGAEQGAVVHYADGAPTAAVPVAELTAAPSAYYRWSDLLGRFGLPTPAPLGLLVGPRVGYQTHFLTAPGTSRTDGVAGLLGELRERFDAHPSVDRACVAMYLDTEGARRLQAAGVESPPVLVETDAWLDLPAGGFDGWVASLPSKRRVSVRREVTRFEDAGYRVAYVPLEQWYEQMAPLAAAVQAKYGHPGVAADYLPTLRRYVDSVGATAQAAICTTAGGDLVGYCIYYVWGDTMFMRWAGFDYARLVDAAEYFNLVYYAQIRRAPELGVRRMHLGIKAREAKALRGAELRPLWLVDLARDSVLTPERALVRQHNARYVAELLADGRTAGALRDRDSWLAFT